MNLAWRNLVQDKTRLALSAVGVALAIKAAQHHQQGRLRPGAPVSASSDPNHCFRRPQASDVRHRDPRYPRGVY